MAEREGFEPSRQLTPPTRFPSVRFQPLSHLSDLKKVEFNLYQKKYVKSIKVPIEFIIYISKKVTQYNYL